MLVLLLMLCPGLYVSSTTVEGKSRHACICSYFQTFLGQVLDEYVELFKELFEGLVYVPNQRKKNLDHFAGLQKLVDNSDEFATKAATAATFLARGIYNAGVGVL